MSDTVTMLISSGGGPMECRQAVAHALRLFLKEAQAMKLTTDIAKENTSHGPKSVVVQVHGKNAKVLADNWTGTIQWICKSNLRPSHKRQNWFLGVFQLPVANEATPINAMDIRFESFRAGGPGGQHQNTTDSAVRATCMRTGLCVVVRDGRSQHRNKTLAMERLQELKNARDLHIQNERGHQKNMLHHKLERGNPRRIFKGISFEEVHK